MTKSALINAPKKAIIKIKFLILAIIIFVFGIVVLLFTVLLINSGSEKLTLTADQLNVQAANISNIVHDAEAKELTHVITIKDRGLSVPELSSLALLIQDFETGRILYSKNIHNRLFPASTTKLMTALVGINNFQLGQVLTVTPGDLVSGSKMGLHSGETVTFRGLLYGMLLNSGNDAAFTIASNFPGGLEAFVAEMNNKVKDLGLEDTHFSNPAGFDSNGHFSSAYDLAIIAKELVKNPQLARIVATKETSVLAMDRSKEHQLSNLNQLLDEPGVIGIKTGFTEKSGENLIGLVERNDHKVLTVILGSTDRFGETKKLIDWVYQNFSWE